MNQEEDEDAFLYGEAPQAATSGSSTRQIVEFAEQTEYEMQQASEEGEVDDEEEEDDSVRTLGHRLSNARILILLSRRSPVNVLFRRRRFLR